MRKAERPAAVLRRAILEAIEDVVSSKRRPPYSATEMIVMALAVEDRPMDEFDIAKWIRTTFAWYKAGPPLQQRTIGLQEAFADPTLTATVVENRRNTSHAKLWCITPRTARSFLHECLKLDSNEPFPFTKLPAELRNKIYEMVLLYLPNGICIRKARNADKMNMSLRMTSPGFGEVFSIDSWAAYRDHGQVSRYGGPSEAFDLFLVSKQILEEAVPIFYQQNIFYFWDLDALNTGLLRLPVYRRQHLRNIAFSYTPYNVHSATTSFRNLNFLASLQRIYIDINEEWWLRGRKETRRAVDPLKIPKLDALAMVRGLRSVSFSRRCPNVAKHVKAMMEEADTKKRKRTDVELTGRRSHPRATKCKKIGYE